MNIENPSELRLTQNPEGERPWGFFVTGRFQRQLRPFVPTARVLCFERERLTSDRKGRVYDRPPENTAKTL